jgi:predicted flap endonuclease-1-like 5' DNA nuclease
VAAGVSKPETVREPLAARKPPATSARTAAAPAAVPVQPVAPAQPAAVPAQPAAVPVQPAAVPVHSAASDPVAPASDPVAVTAATAPHPEPGTAPAAPAGTTSGPVDDLARVEGIGPKIAAALVAAGIRSYRDLGGSDVETLRAALRSAGLRLVPSLPTWPEQARLLADHDTAGLAALTDRLIAGREPASHAASSPTVPPQPQPGPSPEPGSDQRALSSSASAARTRPSTPPDDLKRIEGIGPKMASALNAAGITTFEELAAADEATIRAAVSAAGLRFAPSLVTWAQQARLLARGDEDGFEKLADHLVAGRETGRG